jgi:hypothetical protein
MLDFFTRMNVTLVHGGTVAMTDYSAVKYVMRHDSANAMKAVTFSCA